MTTKPPSAKEQYALYLQTPHWKTLREKILYRDHYSCVTCGGSRRLQVHHLTYERIGHEADDDLKTLCWWCHQIVHKEMPKKPAKIKKKKNKNHACALCKSAFRPKDYPGGGGIYCSKGCKLVAKQAKLMVAREKAARITTKPN